MIDLFSSYQAHRQGGGGGSRGFARTPLSASELYILSALLFEVGPVASPLSKQPVQNIREAVYATAMKGRA